MEQTIEHERTTSAAVKQLRNDLKDEKLDHEEKVRQGGILNRRAGQWQRQWRRAGWRTGREGLRSHWEVACCSGK
jgi:hypothetical protein